VSKSIEEEKFGGGERPDLKRITWDLYKKEEIVDSCLLVGGLLGFVEQICHSSKDFKAWLLFL
jgi:hypothetical protein